MRDLIAALAAIAEQLRIANVIAYTARDGYKPGPKAAAEIEAALRVGGAS